MTESEREKANCRRVKDRIESVCNCVVAWGKVLVDKLNEREEMEKIATLIWG